jgi:hypothetical protein
MSRNLLFLDIRPFAKDLAALHAPPFPLLAAQKLWKIPKKIVHHCLHLIDLV